MVYRGRSFAAAAAAAAGEFGFRSRVRVRVSVGRVRGTRVRTSRTDVRLLRCRRTGRRVPTPVRPTLLLRFAVRTRRHRFRIRRGRRLRERTRFPTLRRPRGRTAPKNPIRRTAVTTVLGHRTCFRIGREKYNPNDPRRCFDQEHRFDRLSRAGSTPVRKTLPSRVFVVTIYCFTPYSLFTYVC